MDTWARLYLGIGKETQQKAMNWLSWDQAWTGRDLHPDKVCDDGQGTLCGIPWASARDETRWQLSPENHRRKARVHLECRKGL